MNLIVILRKLADSAVELVYARARIEIIDLK